MTKDVFETIRERRSIRRYKDQPVPDDIIRQLLEAATLAPNAGNLQPWHFFVVKDKKVRSDLAKAAGRQNFVAEAPVTIVVCADPAHSASRYRSRGAELYCLQDTAAAAQNLFLAATAFGLGTCWVGAFDEKLAGMALNLKENLRPVAIFPVGYPAENPRPRARRPLEQVMSIVDGPAQ